ncbi:ABC transporter permease [Candidatus Thorarchaeota archaeon]|nr:MAG: ABC transporter permease [Candidatus Thorarchaeota archaeon]
MLTSYASLGLKFALRRRRAAIFTILSIGISVSLIISASSVASSLRVNTAQYIRDTTSPVDITISSTKFSSPISYDMMTSIEHAQHVVTITPRIEETVQLQIGNSSTSLILIGLDIEKEENIGSISVSDGSSEINGSYCFMTDSVMQAANLSVGQHIQLYTSAGIYYFDILGSGNALDKGVIGPAVFIHIEKAWSIYQTRYPNRSSNKLLLQLDNVLAIPVTVNRLEVFLGEDFVISNQKSYNLFIMSLFLNQANVILGSLVIGALFVAALRVFSSYSLIFSERKFENGLIRAYGASRSQVFMVLLSEIGIVGVAGAFIGTIIGVFTNNILTSLASSILIIQSPINADVFLKASIPINPSIILMSGLIGFLLSLVAGIFPALIATRQPVVESLRQSFSGVAAPISLPIDIGNAVKRIFLIVGGLLSILVAAQITSDVFHIGLLRNDWVRLLAIPVFILLTAGFSDKLTRPSSMIEAIRRRTTPLIGKLFTTSLKRRFAGALLVFNLFVSISVILLLSSNISYSLTTSWENTLGLQSSSTNVVAYLDDTATNESIEQIKSQHNITSLTELSNKFEFVSYQSNVQFALIFGVDPQPFQRLASIGIVDSLDYSVGLSILDMSDDVCVISDYAAESLGVQLGQKISVADRTNLTVVAICESSAPLFLFTFVNPLFILVDLDTWSSVVNEPFRPDGILLDSQSPETTVANLAILPGVYPVLVSSIVLDYSRALTSFRFTLDISLGLLLATAVTSAVLSGWSAATARRREIGMLRALGMDEKDVAKFLTLEGAVPMLCGTICGIIVGILANISLIDIIMHLSNGQFALVDYRTTIFLIISLILSLIVLYYASLRATRAPTIDLLTNRQRIIR